MVGLIIGCFDPLHYGHIELITRAAELCDFLVVAVTSDKQIAKEKKGHPYFPFEVRKAAIWDIKKVDRVTVHEGDAMKTYGKVCEEFAKESVTLFRGNADFEPLIPQVMIKTQIQLSSTEIMEGRYLGRILADR